MSTYESPPSQSREGIESLVIRAIMAELELPADGLSATTTIRHLAGADSVNILRIVVHIERELGIELQDEVVFEINTVGELAAAVFELCGARAAS